MRDILMAERRSQEDPPQSQQRSSPSGVDRLDFASDCGAGLSPQSSFIEPSVKRQRLEAAEELSMPSATYGSFTSLEDGEIMEAEMEPPFDAQETGNPFSYEDMFAFDDEEEDEPKLKMMEGEDIYSLGDNLIDSDAFVEPDSHLSQQEIKVEDYDTFDGYDSPNEPNLSRPDSSVSQESPGSKGKGDADEDDDDDDDEFEMDPEELDTMLDEGLQGYSKGKKRKTKEVGVEGEGAAEDGGLQDKQKLILIEKDKDPFDILPESWVIITHNSGMPVYLHRPSRVCTLSRPYFLGPGSARKHDIPVSAIPCYQYRKAMEREKEQSEDKPSEPGVCPVKIEPDDGTASQDAVPSPCAISNASQPEKSPNENSVPNGATPKDAIGPGAPAHMKPRVATAENLKNLNSIDADQLLEYCSKLFQFKTIQIKKFRSWKERRHHIGQMKRASRPVLPANTKLITIPSCDNVFSRVKELVFNPAGKTEICILHEYAQHALRVQPKYIYKELENGKTPYSATVLINNVQYGSGYASSKKAAKLEAAKASLRILIPDLEERTVDASRKEDTAEKKVAAVVEVQPSKKPEPAAGAPAAANVAAGPSEVSADPSAANLPSISKYTTDLSFFDEIKVEDPRVTELCSKVGQPTPYQLLLECLKRNFGLGDTDITVDMKQLKHQRSEFTMKVGKHEVKIVCKNKREGKHRAAQCILQKLHPHITTWGSLLRLYNWREVFREKKAEKQLVSELQSGNHPNKAILNKLKQEMMKLYERQQQGEKILDGRPQFLPKDMKMAELMNIDL